MGAIEDYPLRSKLGEPVWELATLYPKQGHWTIAAYLALRSSRLIEYAGGTLEFLPMPTRSHQQIVGFLWQLLKGFLTPAGGDVWFAPIRVRVSDDRFRDPDIVAFLDRDDPRAGNEFFAGADLVMEVVSEGSENRERDYVVKRDEYEAAGIPEYWIVDSEERVITVLSLHGGRYVEHCVAGEGEVVRSALLHGLEIESGEVLTEG
jgi:Uma2 family endonuclease